MNLSIAATALKRHPELPHLVTMLRLMCAMTMVLGAAEAAHGLDNNWTVMVTGMKDGNGCMKATSVEDMGSNLVTSTPTCLSATQMCTDDYECTTARALKPASFTGCTFDETTAAATSAVGVLMDGLCYNNFVVEQKNLWRILPGMLGLQFFDPTNGCFPY